MINISLTFDEEMKLYTLIKIELRHCIKEKRSYEKKLKKMKYLKSGLRLLNT